MFLYAFLGTNLFKLGFAANFQFQATLQCGIAQDRLAGQQKVNMYITAVTWLL